MDVSASIDNAEYSTALEFVDCIVDTMNLSPSGGHAAVTLFGGNEEQPKASNAELMIRFPDFVTPATFKQAVKSLDRMRIGSYTRINFALNHALTQMFNVKNGMRPNVNRTMVFMTDGQGDASDDDYRKWRQQFVEANIEIIAIGIGDRVLRSGLIELSPNNHHFTPNFAYLLSRTFQDRINVCQGTQ